MRLQHFFRFLIELYIIKDLKNQLNSTQNCQRVQNKIIRQKFKIPPLNNHKL